MSQITVDDPALAAAVEVQRAEAEFCAVPVASVADELGSQYVRADARLQTAEHRFADTVPTSPAGAVAKLRELQKMLSANDGECVCVRHVQTVIAYLEAQGGAH